jgi:hypothetical protein
VTELPDERGVSRRGNFLEIRTEIAVGLDAGRGNQRSGVGKEAFFSAVAADRGDRGQLL